jgi:hypothetical protein
MPKLSTARNRWDIVGIFRLSGLAVAIPDWNDLNLLCLSLPKISRYDRGYVGGIELPLLQIAETEIGSVPSAGIPVLLYEAGVLDVAGIVDVLVGPGAPMF